MEELSGPYFLYAPCMRCQRSVRLDQLTLHDAACLGRHPGDDAILVLAKLTDLDWLNRVMHGTGSTEMHTRIKHLVQEARKEVCR